MEWADMKRYYLDSPPCEICEEIQKNFFLASPCSMYMLFMIGYEKEMRISTGSH
jgi:hypothetical protein